MTLSLLTPYLGPTPDPATTVADWSQQIVERETRSGSKSAVELQTAIRRFVEVFGGEPIGSINPGRVVAWARWCRDQRKPDGEPYSNQTVLSWRWAARKVMAEAAVAGVVEHNPFDGLPRGTWPSKRSRRGFEARPLSLLEAARLWSSPGIPLWRRAHHATVILAGLRPGEALGLQHADWRRSMHPLSGLRVWRQWSTKRHRFDDTKTEAERWAPVHPTLAKLLREWADLGWARVFGRAARADDLLFPRLWRGEFRAHHQPQILTWLKRDLATVGLEGRRVHDLRHSFLQACQDADIPDQVAMYITHERGRRRSEDIYRRPNWAWMSKHIARLEAPLYRQPKQLTLL